MRRMRGGAAVELVLTLPILLIFPVALYDYVDLFRGKDDVLEASRNVAWAKGRASARKAPWEENLGGGAGVGTPPGVEVEPKFQRANMIEMFVEDMAGKLDSELNTGFFTDVVGFTLENFGPDAALGTLLDMIRKVPLGQAILDALASAYFEVTDGWPEFLKAELPLDGAKATAKFVGKFGDLSHLLVGKETEVTAEHWVCLRSYPEGDPNDPEGWWDPWTNFWTWLKDAILGLLKSLGSFIVQEIGNFLLPVPAPELEPPIEYGDAVPEWPD